MNTLSDGTHPQAPTVTQFAHPIVKPFRFPAQPHEYKVVPLRECPVPADMAECDTPDKAAHYWRTHITSTPAYNPECECMVVLMLNTRRRIKGHYLVSIGTLDTLLVHPREIFRIAIMVSASAIVLAHNLCDASHKLCCVQRGVMWSALRDGWKTRCLACTDQPRHCT